MSWSSAEIDQFRADTSNLALPGLHGKNNAALRSLAKELQDPFARLHSIEADTAFVEDVVRRSNLPVVGNERCGSWYVDPQLAVPERAYFKSTDGHWGQWGFSLRRANLQLVQVIARDGGLVIVDSTRRGKSFPDALSKTVPIWCTVLNRAAAKLFPHLTQQQHGSGSGWDDLVLPDVLSASEKSQIAQRIPACVEALLASSYPLKDILGALQKPLRPLHVSPSHPLQPTQLSEVHNAFYPVLCLSASRCPTPTQPLERGYVQGAADDHEGWAKGLTARQYWKHKEALLNATREELPALVQDIVLNQASDPSIAAGAAADCQEVRQYAVDNLQFALEPVERKAYRGLLLIKAGSDTPPPLSDTCVPVPSAFKRARDWATFLNTLETRLMKGVQSIAYDDSLNKEEGADWVIACLLIVLGRAQSEPINKATLAGQLHRIVDATNGQANPSRSILKRVNEHLIAKPAAL